jgi:hypothetical protein
MDRPSRKPLLKIVRAALALARDDTELSSANQAGHHVPLVTTGVVGQSTAAHLKKKQPGLRLTARRHSADSRITALAKAVYEPDGCAVSSLSAPP